MAKNSEKIENGRIRCRCASVDLTSMTF